MATTTNVQKIYGSSAVPYDSGSNVLWTFIEQSNAGDNTFAFQDNTLNANVTTVHGTGDTIFIEKNLNPDFKIKQSGRFVYLTEGLSTLKIELKSLSTNKTTGVVSITLGFLNGDVTLSNKPGSKTLVLTGTNDDASKAVTQTLSSTAKNIKSDLNPTADNAALDYFTAPTPPTPVEAFELTTGVDTFVGTALVDIFNAVPVNVTTGALADTLTNYDSIDGGAGVDVFNIYTQLGSDHTTTFNYLMPSTVTVKNVETINIYNDPSINAKAFSTDVVLEVDLRRSPDHNGFVKFKPLGINTVDNIDASKFVGATSINQFGLANDIVNLGANTTAGFYNQTNLVVSVAAASGVSSAHLDFGNISTKLVDGQQTLALGFETLNQAAAVDVWGDALNTVNLTGSLGLSPNFPVIGPLGQYVDLWVHTGLNQPKLTLNTSVNAALTILPDDLAVKLSTVDASGSTGSISFTTAGDFINTLLTGSGNDTVAIDTVTSKTVNALVQTNAGLDEIKVNTSGLGTTTVAAGAGNDTVNIASVSTGLLNVTLGDGNDTFGLGSTVFNTLVTGGTLVNGSAVVDGGTGTDTMSLVGIGSANAGAFTNFEVGDVKSLAGSLDLNLLKAKNSISSLVTSGSLNGNSTLLNVGAGVNFTAYADFGGSLLTLAQATAGALTVSLNVDDTVVDHSVLSEMWIEATNATSLTAVFDSSSLFSTPALQTETIDLVGDAATSLAIVSGGTNANNVLNYYDDAVLPAGLLTSVTVTGTQNLTLELNASLTDPLTHTRISSVNASALTGNLTADLDDLKAGGTLSLGTGDDKVTGQAGADIADTSKTGVVAQERLVSGFEKATAEDLATQNGFDILKIGNAVQAADKIGGDYVVKDGLLTFNGTGPATLQLAVEDAATALVAHTALAFVYNNVSYVLEEGASSADAVLIQLTGTTGLVGLDNIGAGSLYVF